MTARPKSSFRANISRERLRQLRRNAEGVCSVGGCKRRHVQNGRCKEHHAANLKQLREAYAAKKARAK